MERLIAKMGINFKNGPTPHRGAVPNPANKRRYAFSAVAFLAALAVGLLFLLPGGLLQAQSAEQFFDYPENGTGYVATFTASDPEGAMPVVWSLTTTAVGDVVVDEDIEDEADFKIDQNGVLSFRTSPNYEAPADDDADNEYRVTVQASDGDQTGYFEVYVNVTDEEETGKVTWSVDPDGTGSVIVPTSATGQPPVVLRQFQPGASLTASVTDPDAVASGNTTGSITSGITWKWYKGSSVIAGQAEAIYTVMDGDVGSTIRVMATYSDGSGSEESVSLTSASVQTFRRSNAAPAFSPATVSRRIAENSTGNVGGPVAATDANSDTLTYTITGGTDQASFRIDPATGQLMVGPGLKIDFEDTGNTDNRYIVEVRAYDSSGAATATPATVTINVVNEEEKPEFGDVVETDGSEANLMRGMVEENATGTDLNIATYTATDPEGESVSLSLMGDDAGLFELAADTEDGNGVNQVLSFKKSPDFEMPGDRNDDNLYEVTVRASDGTLSADQMVVVKVTNVVEGGKVTLSPEDAVLGVELTATLTDPEGGVSASGQITGERWTWHKHATDADFEVDNGTPIPNATSPTYTPVSGDVDDYLRAMVTYTYQGGGSKTGVSDAVQVQTSRENQAPRFKEGASTFRVVMENVMMVDDDAAEDTDDTADNIGSPVEATDANGDMVTYTLGGADASLFRIRSDGQLEVKGKLDHEMDSSHTVTVTANDGSGGSNTTASITVTIYVTDADEAPKITDNADRGADGQRTVGYPENGDGYVARFTASDPERAMPVAWSLTTTAVGDVVVDEDIEDEADFKIDQNGVLSFRTSPSFEPRGDDDYKVTVQAFDGTRTGYFKVTVNVTDREETGKVTWSVTPTDGAAITGLRQFQSGASLTASVTDPDAVALGNTTGSITSGITWKWYKGSSVIAGQAEAIYTVMDGDVGSTIRVMATYSDGSGPEESVSLTSASVQVASESNAAPAFSPATVSRRIAENSTGNIGGPVAATDTDGDTLTYAITGGTDQASFRIDPATGQLMVGPGLKIDFEDTGNTDNRYIVEVRAYDSSGAATATPATVTINVVNEEEKPEFGDVVETDGSEANLMRGMVEENATGTDLNIATYTATDPEGESVSLSLMGDDAGLFELNDLDTPAAGSKILSFKKSPDFEMPGDRNDDNLYEVTVRASDGTLSADQMVVVKVTNVVEGGKVTLSPEDAVPGVELTATLTDPEGGVSASGQITGERWTWHKHATDADFEVDNGTPIPNATSPTYTPVSGDVAVGEYLRAMVRYVYQHEGDADADRKTGVSDAVQVQTSRENQAPRFKEGASTFRVVMENVMMVDDDAAEDTDDTADNIGSPVAATDANGDTPTYTLGGADASLFRIRSNGQLEVKGKLDHETNTSYTVTVTANDGSGASNAMAMITVIIYVTDVDDPPEIMVGGLRISGPSSPRFAEKGTGPVATYMAAGPNADMVTWSLDSASVDAGDFSISGGMLTFGSSPDYENPMDADMDNVYMVTIKADDRTNMDTHDVMVMVTNEDEPGRVTFWRDGADVTTAAIMVGDELGGAVDDSDGNPGDTFPIAMYTRIANVTSWQWGRSTDMTDWEDIGTGSMYTVMDDDAGHYLRATATYTDEEGSGKTAMAMTDNMVTSSPMFPSETATRSVMENTAAGMDIGAPVEATDADMDTPTYMLGGADAASFDIDSMTGQLMTKAALDFETKREYTLTVTATDTSGASAMIIVTITVTDEDEAGTVTLSTMQPVIGTAVTAMLEDPDGSVSGAMWQWARTTDMTTWEDITGATMETYTPTMDDEDMYLRATVMYTDGHGSDKTAMAMTDNMVTTVQDQAGTVTLSTMQPVIGTAVTAMLEDPDGSVSGAMWQWARTTDMTTWEDITGATMETYTPTMDDEDMYLRATVMYTDGHGSDKTAMAMTDNMVTTVQDQAGTVTLSTMQPVIGTAVTAMLEDPDGSVSGAMWQWARTTDMTTWEDITGATMETYTPTMDDEDMYLRATVMYTDGHGSDKTAMAMTDNMVTTVQDQAGTVTLSTMQPVIGTAVTAMLEDPDGSVSGAMWQWARTTDMTTWEDITGATMETYTPTMDDEDMYLRATVMYTDGHGSDKTAMAMTDNMVTTVQDQAGTVTLSTMQPVIGTAVTAMLEDPDGSVSGAMWQWARTTDMTTWEDITGATMETYTPTMDDEDMYLRATVMYTDGHGSDKTAMAMTDNMVTTVQDQAGTVTLSTMQPVIGTAVTAMLEDPDGSVSGAMWQWARTTDMTTWEDITGATMETYTPTMDDEDMYLRATVMYTDGHGSDKTAMAMTDNMVTTVQDQAGTVTLSTMQPVIGTAVTAMLEDPDGSVSGAMWQWARTTDMTTWEDITGATMETYTPTMDDEDMYLRATVMYTDGHGSDKTAMAMTDNMVTVTAEDPVLTQFDANDDGEIDKEEVVKAISDYLNEVEGISKSDVIAVINYYLDS